MGKYANSRRHNVVAGLDHGGLIVLSLLLVVTSFFSKPADRCVCPCAGQCVIV